MIHAAQYPAVVASSLQTTATLIAALIGGAAAIIAAILSAINAHRSRLWIRREQWWMRFTWAACSRDPSVTSATSTLA